MWLGVKLLGQKHDREIKRLSKEDLDGASGWKTEHHRPASLSGFLLL